MVRKKSMINKKNMIEEAKKWKEAKGIEKWGLEAHCAFIIFVLKTNAEERKIELPIEFRQDLYSLLQENGLGGNSSQFRQKLEGKKATSENADDFKLLD